jgi:hypothetical protein
MSSLEPTSSATVRIAADPGSAALNRALARRVYSDASPKQTPHSVDAQLPARNMGFRHEAAAVAQIGRKLDVRG